MIDAAMLESQPNRATVRRYWSNEADMLGYLVHTSLGFAIRYEANGSPKSHGNTRADLSNEKLFHFGADAVRIGQQVFLTEPDGRQLNFRIAGLN